jgi:hypothetical protein
MLKFAGKAGSVVSVLFNPRIDDFVARAWFLSIRVLETHSSQEAMLLAVTVLGGTICGASVPHFFSRFQALRLECVKFVFSTMSSHLNTFIQLLKQTYSWFFFTIRIEPFVELATLMVPSRNVLILISTGYVTFGCSNLSYVPEAGINWITWSKSLANLS